MMARMRSVTEECPVQVTAGKAILNGSLCIPEKAQAVVIFAHGSGSSRLSPRNQFVAARLRSAGLATLLFDLLTQDEEDRDAAGQYRFNIRLLSERLVGATDWLNEVAGAEKFKVGYFGASTGAAAALVAAAERPDIVSAVVSRGGRPDLAGDDALSRVKAPVLLIVGGNDAPVIDMNQAAMRLLKVEKRLDIVPGATHLFEEPGKLEKVADLAKEWFLKYLGR